MDGLTFDIAHMLAGSLVLIRFMQLYQDRLYALLNVYALHALVLAMSVAWQGYIQDAPHLYLTAVIALVFKAIVIPTALHRIIVRLGIHREIETVVRRWGSMITFLLAGAALVLLTAAALWVVAQSADGWADWVVFGAMLGVNVGLLTVFAHLANKEEERTRFQERTIDQLEAANAALQQALDENAALHAQLLLQAREAGVADERRRLAAEIHDTIAQGLTGIIAQLQVVANTPDRQLAREHLDRATDLARHSLGEARRSVHNLAPVALEHDSLPKALGKTVAEWGDRTGVRADFTVTGTDGPLHEEIEATLLRIVEEALSNAARHAAATRVGVTRENGQRTRVGRKSGEAID